MKRRSPRWTTFRIFIPNGSPGGVLCQVTHYSGFRVSSTLLEGPCSRGDCRRGDCPPTEGASRHAGRPHKAPLGKWPRSVAAIGAAGMDQQFERSAVL